MAFCLTSVLTRGSYAEIFNVAKAYDENIRRNKHIKIVKIFDMPEKELEARIASEDIVAKVNSMKMEEMNFMLAYCTDNNTNNFLVRVFAKIDYGLSSGVLMEKADIDCSMFINKYILEGQSKLKNLFAQKLSIFFVQVLDFMAKNSLVYGDWKFENILCFKNTSDSIEISDLIHRTVLKLTDFGSIMKAGVKIINHNNINLMYGSYTYSHLFDKILPSCSDDRTSCIYMLYDLLSGGLPWKYMLSNIKKEWQINDVKCTIAELKTNPNICLDITRLSYWPDHEYFKIKNELE